MSLGQSSDIILFIQPALIEPSQGPWHWDCKDEQESMGCFLSALSGAGPD